METDLREALASLGPGTGSFLRLFHTYLQQRDRPGGRTRPMLLRPPPPNFAVEYSSIKGCAHARSIPNTRPASDTG